MTISTTTAIVTTTGDGSTTEFSFPYLVFQSSHVSITVAGVVESGWSATGYGESGGITITFDTAPADQSSIVIKRIVPLTQATDLQNFDGNPSDVQEKQFDLNVMISQQQQEQIDRSIKFPSDHSVTSLEVSGTPSSTAQFLSVTTDGVSLGNPTSISFDTILSGEADGDLLKYNGTNWVNVTQASLGLLSDVVSDTTPQLGGSLDVNGNKIVSTSNGNIDIEPNGTGNVLLGNFTFDADQTVGAGQDNYVMTYDHSAGTIGLEAAAGSAGLTLLATATASSDSSVDFTSGIDSTYDEYIIICNNVVPASPAGFYFRTSTNGGSSFDSGASDYTYAAEAITADASVGNNPGGSNGAAQIHLGGNTAAGAGANDSINLVVHLKSPLGTRYTQIYWSGTFTDSSAGDLTFVNGGGMRKSAADVDAIRFLMSTGNIASGEFKLYGVKKS